MNQIPTIHDYNHLILIRLVSVQIEFNEVSYTIGWG